MEHTCIGIGLNEVKAAISGGLSSLELVDHCLLAGIDWKSRWDHSWSVHSLLTQGRTWALGERA